MALIRLVGSCPDGRTCPTVYKTDRGTVAIQGYKLPADELSQIVLPDGETVVEIPIELLEEAVRVYST